MTQEEKAKAYDEALERARKIHNETKFDYEKGMMEEVFPELVVSEDEMIRKALIEGLIAMKSNFHTISSIKIDDAIDWLEKQGKKTQQTPQWMITFLDENRVKFISSMDNYDEQREVEGKLLAIIDWLKKQDN